MTSTRGSSQVRLLLVRALPIVLALMLVSLAGLVAAPGASELPGHLDVLSAEVVELGNIDKFRRVKGRQVAIRIELAEMPECTNSAEALSYGIFIDADKDPNTGLADNQAFGRSFGVDAQAAAHCAPLSGDFVSPLGPVTLGPTARGTVLLEILTRVEMLPSVDFHWLGFALEGFDQLVRVPGGNDHGHWAIFEIVQP